MTLNTFIDKWSLTDTDVSVWELNHFVTPYLLIIFKLLFINVFNKDSSDLAALELWPRFLPDWDISQLK